MARLADEGDALMELVGATGAAVCFEGVWRTVGRVPPKEDLVALGVWLRERLRADPMFATDVLSRDLADAARYSVVASGVLAATITRSQGDVILWFRPEVESTVDWAGDPHKTASLTEGAPRLSPRGSFALWKETVRGQALPWQPWETDAATDLAHALRGAVLDRAAELTRLNRELRAANHAKDEFLATVSHELRTPLNAMLGWLRMLRGDLLPPDRREAALATIERNAKAQAQLVEDLLDVSRIIAGKLRLDAEPVDLATVVDAAIEAVRPGADAKSIRLQPVLSPQAGPVMGDASRLQQVVWNLLSNAVKFTPKGGRVQVRLQRNGSYAEITVVDTGEGIEAALLPLVFERFRQAEGGAARQHQGLGLGLAIVKHLVELHGGSVQAFSEGRGAGSTFLVRLPVASMTAKVNVPPDGHPEPESTSSTQSLGSGSDLDCPPAIAGMHVLVVDDEPDASSLLVAVLTHCRARVTAVDSGADALALLDRERPDVIVSDIGMPGMDGYALIRAIRARSVGEGGRTPAVALTAYARTEDRARAFRAGFQAHVPKPIEPNELLAVLASLVHDGRGSQS